MNLLEVGFSALAKKRKIEYTVFIMLNFVYQNANAIVLGRFPESKIADLLSEYGAKRVLLHYGKGSAVSSGLLGRIEAELTGRKIAFVKYGGVSANPLKSFALKGVEFSRREAVDFVLAIGGGSVIDSAKCIAAGAADGDVWKCYKGERKLKAALPLGCVLTIPAAGSEGGPHSVIRDDESGCKFALYSPFLVPRFAFINPEYCFTLPKEQIAYGASDILAHLLERYFSREEECGELTDALLAACIRTVFRIAPKLVKDNKNYDLWAEMCLCGTLAHNDMLSMGRNGDWGTHGAENAVLSGVHNLAHGAGLAILFPAWLKLMSRKSPERVLSFARLATDARDGAAKPSAEMAIEQLERFYASIGLKTRLSQIGLSMSQVSPVLRDLYGYDTRVGAFGQLTAAEIEELFRLAE
ncbi:NADH-dependent alcohol dehydrogenase [Clostridia bacterium]|nr:NADH-dependent alcohol dehydrogenase [Clostridia bacterium]